MTANIANLLPPIKEGEHRGHRGRAPGVQNLMTRAMRTACLLAAETSKHSDDGSLVAYLRFLADEKPELFAPMLARMLPTNIKAEISQGPPPKRLTPGMTLDEMVTEFTRKIQDESYHAKPYIDHDERDDD